MIRLVKNEIYKLFHKRSTVIVLIVLAMFVILTNVIYKNFGTSNGGFYSYDSSYVEELKYQIDQFGEVNSNNASEYASLMSDYEIQNYTLNTKDSWKINMYHEFISPYWYQYYLYSSIKEYNNQAVKIKQTIDNYMEYLDKGDWKFFVNESIVKLTEEIKAAEEQEDGKEEIDRLTYKKYLLEYRLNENVSYENSYLNTAINNLESLYEEKISYEKAKTEKEKDFYASDYARFMENEYILKEKVDINKEVSNYGVLKMFFEEYLFLILVFVIMVSGAMVSDEFSKGTIKSLLTLPYKRSQILGAKLITSLLMILFITLFLFLVQLLVGTVILGPGSLSIPVAAYNFKLGSIDTMNIFAYMGLKFLGYLPMLALLSLLSLSLSVLILSTSFAITITFFGYFGSALINQFALLKKVSILDYFVTTNWDLSYFVFGGSSSFGIPIWQSIVTCLIYGAIMIVVMFMVFKKRNIKNI